MRVVENIGKQYGMWTILKNIGNGKGHYLCRCDCGNEKVVQLYHIKSGKSKSCGCLRKQITSDRHKRGELKAPKGQEIIHGMTGSKIYGLWSNMMSSIKNPNFIKYKYVGGKGITCEERWNDFQQFYNDVKDKYELATKEIGDSVSLCRIDTNSNYVLDNIYFGSKSDGMKQGTRDFIIREGKRYTKQDLIKELGISFYIAKRIIDRKWDRKQFEEYLFNRVKKFKYNGEWLTAREIIEKYKIALHPKTFFDRIKRYGLSIDSAISEEMMSNTSLAEKDIRKFIKSLGINIKSNKKFFYNGKKNYEIDIFIEEFNIGFEYNGIYWHSTKQKNDRSFHQKKKTFFKEKGINLIYIRGDEWLNKQEIVKSMIRNKVGLSKKIYARKCSIIDISQQQFNDFCDNNHIQGKTSSTKHRYGLEYNGCLVSVMGFTGDHELNRFCSILDHNVVGGFQKLLQHHIKIYSPKQIVSFAALDVVDVDNNIYSKNGFKATKEPNISYFYVDKNNNRYHKSLFRKDKIVKKFGYKFKEGETEYDAMEKLGYYRCYNSGIQKYVLKL